VFAVSGRRLVVLDRQVTMSDLVCGITEVLASVCARLYGQRVGKARAARGMAVATGEGTR
jgi:putative resolvase